MFVRCHNWVWTCRRTEATAFALSPNTWPMSNELRPSNLYSSNAASSRGESLESAAGSLFRGTVDFSCSLCPGLVLFDEFECLTEKGTGAFFRNALAGDMHSEIRTQARAWPA